MGDGVLNQITKGKQHMLIYVDICIYIYRCCLYIFYLWVMCCPFHFSDERIRSNEKEQKNKNAGMLKSHCDLFMLLVYRLSELAVSQAFFNMFIPPRCSWRWSRRTDIFQVGRNCRAEKCFLQFDFGDRNLTTVYSILHLKVISPRSNTISGQLELVFVATAPGVPFCLI